MSRGPMPKHRLSILHISDLHARTMDVDELPEEAREKRRQQVRREAASRARVLGEAWTENLRTLYPDNERPDLVCFTGDVADWGLTSEYTKATEFVDEMVTTLRISRAHVYVVPGNHDVKRYASRSEWERMRELLRTDAHPTSEWLAGGHPPRAVESGDADAVLQRTAAFWRWVEVGLSRPELLPHRNAHRRLGYHHVPELPHLPFKVNVIGLDSAWLAGDENDQGKLWLTEHQRDMLLHDEYGQARAGFRLALMHHPPEELAQPDIRPTRRALAKAADLLLHGHQHDPAGNSLVSLDGDTLRTLAAGCLYEGSEGNAWKNGCQRIDLVLNDAGRPLQAEIHFRAWSSHGHWHPDSSLYRGLRDGRMLWDGWETGSGTLDNEENETSARVGSSLRAHPDINRHLDQLKSIAETWTSAIRSTIGDYHLPRPKLISALLDASQTHDIVLILGESGIGKSALVQEAFFNTTEKPSISTNVIIGLPEDFESWLNELAIDRMRRVLEESPYANNILIIDELEHIADTPTRERALTAIIHAAYATSNWRIIATCQPHAADSIITRLWRKHNVDFSDAARVFVPKLAKDELNKIARNRPNLRAIIRRTDLHALLSRPIILALLQLLITSDQDSSPPTAEYQIVDTLWKVLCATGSGNELDTAKSISELARSTAESRRKRVPIECISSPVHSLTPAIQFGFIVSDGSTLSFGHDLFEEYARQKILRGLFLCSHFDSIQELVSNPRWHRPLRRLSSEALDRGEVDQWTEMISTLYSHAATADLILEGIAFSAEPAQSLNSATQLLLDNNGALAKRFLHRFFRVCSQLPQGLNRGRDELSSMHDPLRLPSSGAWWPVICWLTKNHETLHKLAQRSFLAVSHSWLRFLRSFPEAEHVRGGELASAVLTIAETHAMMIQGHEYASGDEWIYRALFLAAKYDMTRAIPLLRHFAGLRSVEEGERIRNKHEEARKQVRHALVFEGPMPEPWSNGPTVRPLRDFQKLALGAYAQLIVDFDVGISVDLFGALHIKPPEPKNLVSRHVERDGCIASVDGTDPPWNTYPPIHSLLTRSPVHAIGLITQLVDFATERWIDQTSSHGILETCEILINSNPNARSGDMGVFSWSRGTWGPKPICAMLMTAEKWLTDDTDRSDAQTSAITKIVRESKSVAFLGLLTDVAYKHHDLLENVLEPLITSRTVYEWARMREFPGNLSDWTLVSGSWKDEAVEWHTREYRKTDLLLLVQYMYTKKSLQWPTLESAVDRWRTLIAESEPGQDEWLEYIYEHLDSSQFTHSTGKNGETVIQWIPSPTMQERYKLALSAQHELFKSFDTLAFRCAKLLKKGSPAPEVEDIQKLLHEAYLLDTQTNDIASIVARAGVSAVAMRYAFGYLLSENHWMEQCKSWMVESLDLWPSSFSRSESYSHREVSPANDFVGIGIGLSMIKRNDPIIGICHVLRFLRVAPARAVGSFFLTLSSGDFIKSGSGETVLFVAIYVARLRYLGQIAHYFARSTNRVLNLHDPAEVAAYESMIDSIETLIDDDFTSFVAEITSDQPRFSLIGWSKVGERIPSTLKTVDTLHPHRAFGFDENYLGKVFAWLPGYLGTNVHDVARQHAFELIRVAHDRIAHEVTFRNSMSELDKRQHQIRLPGSHSFSNFVVDTAIALCTTESTTSMRRNVWLSWLSLDPEYHSWTESFILGVHRIAAKAEVVEERPYAMDALVEIVEHATSNKDWILRFSRFDRDSVACAVLGFSRSTLWISEWPATRGRSIEQVEHCLSDWCDSSLQWANCLTALLVLLCSPAGASVRLQALGWLQSDGLPWRGHDDTLEWLRKYLSSILDDRRYARLSSDDHVRLEHLLTVLLEHQVPGAETLATRLGAT